MIKWAIYLALLFFGFNVYGQKKANIWYFSNQAGLDFNFTPTRALTNSLMYSQGSSSICNSEGLLLFYSDGYTIYDSTHNVMPNGQNMRINSNWAAIQSALIVPMPGNTHIYYLFTNELTPYKGVSGNAHTILCYSIIDMRLNGGKGDVVPGKRNIELLDKTMGMLAGTQHANGSDYWILTHKALFDTSWYQSTYDDQSDSIYAWFLGPNGLNPQPVITKTGRKTEFRYNEFMKLSPDGKKIAYSNISYSKPPELFASDSVQIGDFDISTGKIGKLMGISNGKYLKDGEYYGIEFSPNSHYLYLNDLRHGALYQFNAQAKTSAELLASKILIDSIGINFQSQLQLAPNGKIYVTREYRTSIKELEYLDAILEPDSAGAKCKFTKKHIYLGGKTAGTLPIFVSSFLKKVPLYIQSTSTCNGDTTFLSIPYMNDPDSVKWDFGDAGSGASNYSRNIEDYHLYKIYGTYKVTAIVYDENKIDTLRLEVKINGAKADFKANDVCENDSVVFINNSGFGVERSYYWKFGDGLTSEAKNPKHLYNVNGVSKTYNVTLISSIGEACKDSIIKAISVNANPKSDFTFTTSGYTVDFRAVQTGNTSYKWLFGNGDSATSQNVVYTYPNSGKYIVCLKTINAAGCSSKTCTQVPKEVGIKSIHKPSGFKIYSNPNTGNFTIEIETSTKDVSIEVYDLLGHLIKTIETMPTKKTYSVEMNVADGIYLVRVSNGTIVFNQKIIVSK